MHTQTRGCGAAVQGNSRSLAQAVTSRSSTRSPDRASLSQLRGRTNSYAMHDSGYVGNRTSAPDRGGRARRERRARVRGRRGRSEIVLIGPACAGKSTVGDLLGEALSTAHVDADHVAERYYLEAGWSVERFRSVELRSGLLEAYRDGEQAMVFALEQVLGNHRGCVFSLGAAHTHSSRRRSSSAPARYWHRSRMSYCFFHPRTPRGRSRSSATAAAPPAFIAGVTRLRPDRAMGYRRLQPRVRDADRHTEGQDAEDTRDEIMSALAL